MNNSTINSSRVVKASVIWMTIVYILCFAVVAMWPGMRDGFMMYSFHAQFDMGTPMMTGGNFISGLILWDVIAALGAWLFVTIYNSLSK